VPNESCDSKLIFKSVSITEDKKIIIKMKTLNYFKSAIQRKEGTGNSVRGYTRRALRGIALLVGSLADPGATGW